MRFIPALAASLLALGGVLGGFTAAGHTAAPQPVHHRAVASELPTSEVLFQPMTDHGNG
ncbi:hypothetical protein [Streptomyces sp. NPDC004520]|uniref:hypothetical protein n=1 Tax=unclassified Streptomyces TaxID=2593676 RepID=UPI0036777216